MFNRRKQFTSVTAADATLRHRADTHCDGAVCSVQSPLCVCVTYKCLLILLVTILFERRLLSPIHPPLNAFIHTNIHTPAHSEHRRSVATINARHVVRVGVVSVGVVR